VASPEKLLLEAEFAFRNISPGSTKEKKYTAKAKRYASKLVRQYPASSEAERAHDILRHLGVGHATAKPKPPRRSRPKPRPSQPYSPSPHADHTPEPPHRHSEEQRNAISKALALPKKRRLSRGERVTDDDSWTNIWQTFLGLSYTKKKILGVVLLFVVFIIGFTPFLLVFFIYYAVQPASLRRHIHQAVSIFA